MTRKQSHVLDRNAEHIDSIDPRLNIIVPTLIRLDKDLDCSSSPAHTRRTSPTYMQTVHAREPYKLECHRSSFPDVLLAQRNDLGKRRVAGGFHVCKADRGLVYEQFECLGSAFGRCGGS